MPQHLILTGDLNLMNVTDPTVPFRKVVADFRAADIVFSNMECCLYAPPGGHAWDNEGFFAAPGPAGEALKYAGIAAVGIANNVNYGEAAITSSVARLDEIGVPHVGAGANRAAAYAPVIIERDGVRYGFLQRTSVFWPTNHEATAHTAGVATIKGHTAYQVPNPKSRPDIPPANRPGVPPEILTWPDAAHLKLFVEDIAALRAKVDVLVASCHWGLNKDVLSYMTDIAHAAIDAGADVVMGHGPHYSLPVEIYRDKPVLYGLGSFSFHTGHGGRKHGDWMGMMARVAVDGKNVAGLAIKLVRHNDANETYFCDPAQETAELGEINERCRRLGTRLVAKGGEVVIERL
jgi:poly-gamma-glutamate capsule biosynthesis protein CapA/YwtB (metallophosphatase superfamily)